MIITIGHRVEFRDSLTKASRKKSVRETEETVPQGSLYISNIQYCSRKIAETIRLPTAPANGVILLGISMNPVHLDKNREPYSQKIKLCSSPHIPYYKTCMCHPVICGMFGSTIFFYIVS